MRILQLAIAATALSVATLSLAKATGANGYWNVPSTFNQILGYGWGAGYHAPLVLGPVSFHEAFDHKEVRLPYPPAPPCGYCHADFNCGGGYPSRLEGEITPLPHASPAMIPDTGAAPLPAPIFAAPIEP